MPRISAMTVSPPAMIGGRSRSSVTSRALWHKKTPVQGDWPARLASGQALPAGCLQCFLFAGAGPMTWKPEIDELREREALGRAMGGPEKIKRQHDGGKLTVRERVERLLDAGSFHEIGTLAGKAEYD